MERKKDMLLFAKKLVEEINTFYVWDKKFGDHTKVNEEDLFFYEKYGSILHKIYDACDEFEEEGISFREFIRDSLYDFNGAGKVQNEIAQDIVSSVFGEKDFEIGFDDIADLSMFLEYFDFEIAGNPLAIDNWDRDEYLEIKEYINEELGLGYQKCSDNQNSSC